MRDIREPHHVPTVRPPERRRIAVGRRNPAPELFILLGAVPLAVDEAVAGELEGLLRVVAGGVLREVGVAGREVGRTRGRGEWEGVVGGEV